MNGSSDNTATNSTTVNADSGSQWYLCNKATALGEGLNGSLDELALYDYALSPTRIAAHYAAR